MVRNLLNKLHQVNNFDLRTRRFEKARRAEIYMGGLTFLPQLNWWNIISWSIATLFCSLLIKKLRTKVYKVISFRPVLHVQWNQFTIQIFSSLFLLLQMWHAHLIPGRTCDTSVIFGLPSSDIPKNKPNRLEFQEKPTPLFQLWWKQLPISKTNVYGLNWIRTPVN